MVMPHFCMTVWSTFKVLDDVFIRHVTQFRSKHDRRQLLTAKEIQGEW